jgi:hypothetical protein
MAGDSVGEVPELGTRIQTYPMLDEAPQAFRVSWVQWDSGFRAAGLLPGDLIVAVDGKPIVRPEQPEELSRWMPSAIGQYDESRRWAAAGAKAGAPVSLRVLRRRVGDAGWQELELQGPLLPRANYRNAEGRLLLSPDGPECDGYSTVPGAEGTWESWYTDKLVARMSYVTEDWTRGLTTRFELQQHLLHEPRVKELAARYPGPFAASVEADWTRVRELLAGTRYAVSPKDLDFRKAEDERVAHVGGLATAAWQAFVAAHAAETIPAFPALDPVHADRATVAGKLVLLPAIENRNWVAESVRNYFALGSDSDGWYFADAESDAALRMLRAARRYQRLVSPALPASYLTVGRVLPDPRLLVMDKRGVYGLQFEPVAALAGEQMFVDLTQVKDGESLFEGEAAFSIPSTAVPAPGATPRQVMEALVDALKAGDQATWNALFATWWVSLEDGKALIHPSLSDRGGEDWEASRRLVLDKVCDVRVAWTGEVRAVTSGKEFERAPLVEEVTVALDHVGLFDGEYRAYQNVGMNCLWTLQRSDGGPWRIISRQGI